MCKISIIVPIYNAEKYILKCLDSLANQTIDDYEVILINDGSTDGTLLLLNDYTKRFPNIFKVYSIDNSGQGKARNEGIKYAKGEFIAFVDSDDYIESTMYEELYEFASESLYDLVVCPYFRVDQNNNILGEELTSLDNVIKINTSPWNKIFRRKRWIENDVKFAENLWYEDVLAIYQYVFVANKVGFYNKPLYYYVYREQSSINIYSEKVNDIFKVLDLLYVYLNSKGLLEVYYNEIETIFILHGLLGHLSRCANEPIYLKRNQYIKEAKQYIKQKFPLFYNNQYMKLRNPIYVNDLTDFIKCGCFWALRLNLFDFVLVFYRILLKNSVTIKRW